MSENVSREYPKIAPLDQFLETSRQGYSEPERLGLRFDPKTYAGNTVPHGRGRARTEARSIHHRSKRGDLRKQLNLLILRHACVHCRMSGCDTSHFRVLWVWRSSPF